MGLKKIKLREIQGVTTHRLGVINGGGGENAKIESLQNSTNILKCVHAFFVAYKLLKITKTKTKQAKEQEEPC